MASPKLHKLFPPSGSCTCDICKGYCFRPGWWSVDEAIKAVNTDYADKFMLEISPEYSFAVISPAFKGAESNFALQEFSKNGCTFFNNDLCELFDTGFMPFECRFCHHTRIGEGKKCHNAIEKEWNTYKGQKTVDVWIKKINFKWKDYYHSLISKKEMLDIILKKIPHLKENWEKYKHLFKRIEIPAKTILLNEGEVSRKMFMIKEGCLRIWFNNNGRDVTIQFFFENEGLSSMESFFSGEPGRFTIESIEPCVIDVITKEGIQKLFKEIPEMHALMNEFLLKRLMHYADLFFSRVKDNPEERYLDLMKNSPHIIQRVPQHYIASYLGITPVSLSRIRNRLAKIS